MNNREQFEEWVDSNFPFKKDRFHIFRDEYKSQFTRQLWEAWQASRSAVEVDIPPALADDEYFIDGIFQPMRYERDVERAVIRAGMKIKGD